MRRRVSVRTGPLSLNTRDTVATETSASRATSLIVALIPEILPAAERPARPHAQAVSLYGSPRWIADVTVYIVGIVRTLAPGCQAAVTASLPGLGNPRPKGARRGWTFATKRLRYPSGTRAAGRAGDGILAGQPCAASCPS